MKLNSNFSALPFRLQVSSQFFLKSTLYSIKPTQAFTLVELIVVITILAILWTIWFVSYTWFMSTARDSNRFIQLEWIHNGLEIYKTRWKLPLPDDSVTIYASWTIIWYQWNAWETVLNKIWYQKWWKDPLDDMYYTYYTDKKQQNIELLWFLENDPVASKETTFNITEKWPVPGVVEQRTEYWYEKEMFLLSSWAKLKDPLNTDNLSKQSLRDFSTLLGMTRENNEVNANNDLIDSGSSPEWQHSKIGEESILPPFVKGARGFSSLKTKAYSLKTISSVNATDYTERTIATYWKKLWILLDTSNNPIQENISLKTSWLDVVTTTWSYSAVFTDKDKISWTWVVLQVIQWTSIAWSLWNSCKDYLDKSKSLLWKDWVYQIKPSSSTWSFSVYCDMTTDWGGWISISRLPIHATVATYCVTSRVTSNNMIFWKSNSYWKLSDSEINSLLWKTQYEILAYEDDGLIREKFWTNHAWDTIWSPWVEKAWKNWGWVSSSDSHDWSDNCWFQWPRQANVTYYSTSDLSWNWTLPCSDTRWLYRWRWNGEPLTRMFNCAWTNIFTTLLR